MLLQAAFGTVDSWLLQKLTKGRVHATEYSNASRTLLYNIRERDWDELLLESDLEKPAVVPKKKGCPPTRKACKDCSCGRREREDGGGGDVVTLGDLAADAAPPVKSSCGSCSLGDAFRCEGCPFLGMPAFEKGQEQLVLLQKAKLAADI